jgi:hypothetical protein
MIDKIVVVVRNKAFRIAKDTKQGDPYNLNLPLTVPAFN